MMPYLSLPKAHPFGGAPFGALPLQVETLPLPPHAMAAAPTYDGGLFMAQMSGGVWPGSVDVIELAATYGTEAFLTLCLAWSLFCDSRATADDPLPTTDMDRRGHWADGLHLATDFADNARPKGSKLWLLSRTHSGRYTIGQVQGYIEDACAWMVGAGICDAVSAQATRTGDGKLVVLVVMQQDGNNVVIRFRDFWEVYRVNHH